MRNTRSRIVNCVCLRSCRLRWRRKDAGEGHEGEAGRDTARNGRVVASDNRRTERLFSPLWTLYSPLSCSSDAHLTVDDIVPVVRGTLTGYGKSRGERKGTPGDEARIMDEMRMKRTPRSRCGHDDDDNDALAATSNREKMLLRSQRYRALFWRTSARACQLRPASANHVPPRCKCIYRASRRYVCICIRQFRGAWRVSYSTKRKLLTVAQYYHTCRRARARPYPPTIFERNNNVILPSRMKCGRRGTN